MASQLGSLLHIALCPLLEHELFASCPTPDVLDVVAHGLKVRRGVIRARDKDVVVRSGRSRRKDRCHLDEPGRGTGESVPEHEDMCLRNPYSLVVDGTEQLETGLELCLGVVGLYNG